MALKGLTHWDSPAEGPSRGTAHHTRTARTRASRAELRAPASHLWASWWLSGKESACNAGDLGSIPALGRCPGEGKGYPLQYSGLENSTPCVVHGAAKSWTQLSDFHFQMPAGVLTWAGGDHPPLPSFFPQNPSLAPSLPHLMSPSAMLQHAVFSLNSRSLFSLPLTLPQASGMSAPSSPAAPESRDFPRGGGRGWGILSCTSVARFSCWVGVVVVATAFVAAPKEKPLDCWGSQGALHSWDPLDCDDLRVPGGPPALKGHRQQWKHTPHLSEKEAR